MFSIQMIKVYYHIHIKHWFSMWGWIIDFIVCTHLDILSSTAWKHGGWCPYPWIQAEDGWEVGGAGGWYRGAQLAGVLAVPLFNRGSSARRRQCTWRPAWSPRMWAWSETRAAGSHNDQCHATRRCRNISLPGRRPSHQSLQQQGLGADKERGIILSEICWWPGTLWVHFQTNTGFRAKTKSFVCQK